MSSYWISLVLLLLRLILLLNMLIVIRKMLSCIIKDRLLFWRRYRYCLRKLSLRFWLVEMILYSSIRMLMRREIAREELHKIWLNFFRTQSPSIPKPSSYKKLKIKAMKVYNHKGYVPSMQRYSTTVHYVYIL